MRKAGTVVMVVSLSCAVAALVVDRVAKAADVHTFKLHVMNASRTASEIDVAIYIDGAHKVTSKVTSTESADADRGPSVSIPAHASFEWQLSVGRHVLRAVSEKAGAELTREFELSGDRWGLLGYEYSSDSDPPATGRFELTIQSTPILFQ